MLGGKVLFRGVSATLIVAAMIVPRLTTVDNGIWALAALMLGIAILVGSYYHTQDPKPHNESDADSDTASAAETDGATDSATEAVAEDADSDPAVADRVERELEPVRGASAGEQHLQVPEQRAAADAHRADDLLVAEPGGQQCEQPALAGL